MKLSTKGRYATRALVELAAENGLGPVYIKKLARDQEISEKYLERIFATLKAQGLVNSVRGAKGGYTLAKDPAEITLLEVIQALEGSLAPVGCVDDAKICNKSNWCVTRSVWTKVKEAVENTLHWITLKELAEEYKSKLSLKALDLTIKDMYFI